MWLISSGQAGDTMVEVLIAIAVISSVLGSAYAITNRSVQTNQGSQERSVATKVAEAQLELLKSYTQNGAGVLPDDFCLYIDTASNSIMSQNIPPAPPHPDNCYRDADGNLSTAPGDRRYQLAVNRSTAGSESLFTVNVDWDGPTGQRDSVSMVYKAYQ